MTPVLFAEIERALQDPRGWLRRRREQAAHDREARKARQLDDLRRAAEAIVERERATCTCCPIHRRQTP